MENIKTKKLVQYKKWIIYSIFILMVLIVAAIRLTNGHPLIYQEESYFNLYSVEEGVINSSFQGFLSLIIPIIPENLIFLLSPIIGIFTIMLIFSLSKKLKIKNRLVLFFLLVFVLSPASIITYTTLSSYSFMFLLLLLGFHFLIGKKFRYLSIPFFVMIPFIDTFSSILLLILLFSYRMFIEKRQTDLEAITNFTKEDPTNLSIIAVLITTITTLMFFTIPWINFEHSTQSALLNIFSDFGAISGMSSFAIILAFIGLSFCWKKQRVIYWLLAITIPSYIWNTQALFIFAILLSYLSGIALTKLSEVQWRLKDLKHLTLFLLILGLLFSSITFIDRVDDFSPTLEMKNGLDVIYENANKFERNTWKVLAVPEDNYFIKYYTKQNTFDHSKVHLNQKEIQQIDINTLNKEQEVFAVPYPHILFPLLEEQSVRYVFVDEKLKSLIHDDEGLRFALRNERFKILFMSENVEVWKFK